VPVLSEVSILSEAPILLEVPILPGRLYFLNLIISIGMFLLMCYAYVSVLLDMCCNESSTFLHTAMVFLISLAQIPVTLRARNSPLVTFSPIGAYTSAIISSMCALKLWTFMSLNLR